MQFIYKPKKLKKKNPFKISNFDIRLDNKCISVLMNVDLRKHVVSKDYNESI